MNDIINHYFNSKENLLKHIFFMADYNQNGYLEKGEFIHAITRIMSLSPKELNILQINLKDRISLQCFINFGLKCLDHIVQDRKLDDLFKYLDKDNDGLIDINNIIDNVIKYGNLTYEEIYSEIYPIFNEVGSDMIDHDKFIQIYHLLPSYLINLEK